MRMTLINDVDVDNNAIEARQPIAVSDISVYICLIDIRSKSKEQLNERRAGLSSMKQCHEHETSCRVLHYLEAT